MTKRALFVGMLLSSPALAEVADKEPTVLQLWITTAIITAIAFVLGLKRPALALLLLPVALFRAWGQIDELHDPIVAHAIRVELGDAYIAHEYLTAAIGGIGPLLAWAVLHVRRARGRR